MILFLQAASSDLSAFESKSFMNWLKSSAYGSLLGSMLPILLFVLLVYFICIRPANKKRTLSRNQSKTENDKQITSIADVRKAEKLHVFNESVKILRADIESEIEKRQSDGTKDLYEANQSMIRKLKELLARKIGNDKDLEYVTWLFNCGSLRTEEEIKERQKSEFDCKYVNSGQYAEDCFVNKTLWGLGGFLIPFILCLLLFWKPLWVFAFVPAIFFGLLFSLIGMVIATNQNIDRAREHNVPANHPRLRHDLTERSVAGAAGVMSAISVGRHAKKATKELLDVDSWKTMK